MKSSWLLEINYSTYRLPFTAWSSQTCVRPEFLLFRNSFIALAQGCLWSGVLLLDGNWSRTDQRARLPSLLRPFLISSVCFLGCHWIEWTKSQAQCVHDESDESQLLHARNQLFYESDLRGASILHFRRQKSQVTTMSIVFLLFRKLWLDTAEGPLQMRMITESLHVCSSLVLGWYTIDTTTISNH